MISLHLCKDVYFHDSKSFAAVTSVHSHTTGYNKNIYNELIS